MKYIVIRKELYESMMNMLKEHDKISIHIQTTEIDTDQSIEERAKKYAESLGISKTDKRYNQYIEDAIKDYTQGATEQSLIEKMKAKEIIYALEEYQKLLCDELDEVVGMAAVHGWKSRRHEQGSQMRENIAKLKLI